MKCDNEIFIYDEEKDFLQKLLRANEILRKLDSQRGFKIMQKIEIQFSDIFQVIF
jgi:hypothetical protein